MYKITLYDANWPGFVSGTTVFFTEDIQEFQREWLNLEKDESTKSRFLRSLNGEIVTDHYSDDPELNIVQEDKAARIFGEEELCFSNEVFTLSNIYKWTSRIKAETARFQIRRFQFQGRYLIAGRYKISGVAEMREGGEGYERRYVYGNSVLKAEYHSDVAYGRISGENLRPVSDFSNYQGDVIESICYVAMKGFESLEEMQGYQIKKQDLEYLMRDIPGEAG